MSLTTCFSLCGPGCFCTFYLPVGLSSAWWCPSLCYTIHCHRWQVAFSQRAGSTVLCCSSKTNQQKSQDYISADISVGKEKFVNWRGLLTDVILHYASLVQVLIFTYKLVIRTQKKRKTVISPPQPLAVRGGMCHDVLHCMTRCQDSVYFEGSLKN